MEITSSNRGDRQDVATHIALSVSLEMPVEHARKVREY